MDESDFINMVIEKAVTSANIVTAKYLGFDGDEDLYEIQIKNGEAFSFTMEEILNANNEGFTLIIER